MSKEIMLILLVLMSLGYVIMSYRKLIKANLLLKKLHTELEHKANDRLRREHNAIARDYNNTLEGFVGKYLGKKLKYEKKEMIEK